MERSATDTPESAGVELERKELIAILRRHIEGLTEVERDLLTCCYGANMPHRKAGELLGLSQASVSEKLQQICQRLRSNLTKIGVAAVLPLLCAEGFHEAMTGGHPCPPGMVERLAQRIETTGGHSVRKLAKRSWFSNAGTAVTVAVVVGAACGAWLWSQQQPTVALAVPATTGDARLERMEGEAPIHGHWTFEKGPAADLTPMQRTWTWRAQGNSGEMVSPPESGLLIPIPLAIPHHPVAIKIKALQEIGGEFAMTALWMNNRITIPTRQWLNYKRFRKDDPPFRIDATIYAIDRYLICDWNGLVGQVVEASSPYPSRTLSLSFRKLVVQEIEVQSIAPTEIPEALRDIPKLIQQMGVEVKDYDDHGNPVEAESH